MKHYIYLFIVILLSACAAKPQYSEKPFEKTLSPSHCRQELTTLQSTIHSEGVEDAVNNAIAKAGETVRNLRWFEVKEIRGAIKDDLSVQWQVTVKLGFALE